MTTINIHKAQPIGNQQVESVIIQIEETLPEFTRNTSLIETATRFDEQAQTLFDALSNSLPGGTIDRLLGKMLAYKASHFQVLSWGDEKSKENAT